METKRCKIYQTDDRRWSFMGWSWAMTHGFEQGAYKAVYEMEVPAETDAEAIFRILNVERPKDYRARSLSMSDVVVFLSEDSEEALYCDSVGFKSLDHDFWEETGGIREAGPCGTKLKCPKCGSTDRFVSNQWIEHHDAIFDGDGNWVGDSECYDSEHDTDGAMCTCMNCDHEGMWQEFEEAAEPDGRKGGLT